MEKYIRTVSGDIWELDSADGFYHRPNVLNVVAPDSDAIVSKGNELWQLIREGDLIIFFLKGHGHIVVKSDASRLSEWNIKEIYTQYAPLCDYKLQAFCSSGVWHIR